jgi:SAM-dependent methyltransferase
VNEFARSFGSVAGEYDRLRPGYPAAAIEAALPDRAQRVADVGAGTGKLTTALLGLGLDVVAVEPDDRMREVLAIQAPRADVRSGTAEQLPINDRDVDSVLYAQAWHWAEPVQATTEARRVLRPGGSLGMLWNLHDDRQEWVAELLRLSGSEASLRHRQPPGQLAGFGPPQTDLIEWSQPMSPDQVVGLVATWSGVNVRPTVERQDVLSQIAALFADEAHGAGEVVLPYACLVWRYTVLGGGS